MPRSSRSGSAPSSRDRLLAAAMHEFASRGFDGAKVDRIAARARVNKAMLYYHFESKAALYRAILLDLFRAVAERVVLVRHASDPPDVQLRGFVAAIAHEALARPHFSPLWLRELAEAGRHIDEAVILEVRRVVGTLAAILDDGRRAGVFRPADPFVIHVSIVAPLLLLAATAQLRRRFGHLVPGRATVGTLDAAVTHVQAMVLAALTTGAARPAAPSRRRPRS